MIQRLLVVDHVSHDNPIANLTPISTSKDLAYVIYTSGTTGKPKGVMIEQGSVSNLISSKTSSLNFDKSDSVLWLSDYIFDASIEQLFLPLFNGAMLYIPTSTDIRDVSVIRQKIVHLCITYLHSMPNYLAALGAIKEPHCLKKVLSGGEAICDELISLWKDILINAYGPTETTVLSIQDNQYGQSEIVNCIGRPLDNTQVYVLNKQAKLVPIGALGELYIGGAGLARGYLNQAELTHDRFINNPFATTADKEKGYTRLYKTGDLVRYLPDGNIEYLGRNDFQVKIRGYRIELGEIEAVLIKIPEVKQAVVVDLKKEGNKYLAAYLIKSSDTEIEIDFDKLRSNLSLKLPDYMIPATFTVLDTIPLTINGKLDTKALPTPQFVSSNNYVAPRNELEEKLCNTWQEVLGVKKVGIHDNFFRIGGDSIVSIQLVSMMRMKGFTLQVKAIYDAPTVAQLSCLLTESTTNIKIKTEQEVLTGEFDLLPIQAWFFDQKLDKPHHWNQSFIIKIPGEIKSEEIEKTLKVLARQHDMLRCVFLQKQAGYQQQYQEETTKIGEPLNRLHIADIDDKALLEKLTQMQSNFHCFDGPLWQAAHLTGYQDGSARLFFAFHHLIIDTVSWRIIALDVKQILTGQSLHAKGSSYRQWVKSIQNYGLTHQHEREYWQTVCAHKSEQTALGDMTHQTISLSLEQTDALLHQANLGFHTQINDLLLSALSIALSELFAHHVNHITLEGHGREVIDESLDVSNTVGWFTNAYPVRLEAQQTITDTIIQTKEMLSAIPNKGIGYGALYSQQVTQKTLAWQPQINFNYLGQLGNHNNVKKSNEKQSTEWQIVAEDTGQMIASENNDSLLLDINGATQLGVLQFSIASRLPEQLSNDFVKRFQSTLIEVIELSALKAKSGGICTLSDLEEVYLIVNEKSNDPIFVLPPGNGGAESYLNNLIPKLKDKKVILFNNLYLEGSLKTENVLNYYTFEKLATQYVRYIKKLQPIGPYELFGWSFGGVLALEIARQLENNGDEISKIILIDSYFNYKKEIKAICQGFSEMKIQKIQDNINYKYQCNIGKYITNAEIVLFKFSKINKMKAKYIAKHENKDEVLSEKDCERVASSYNKTTDNHINDYVSCNSIKIIPLESTHFTWVESSGDIDLVVKSINSNSKPILIRN